MCPRLPRHRGAVERICSFFVLIGGIGKLDFEHRIDHSEANDKNDKQSLFLRSLNRY